MKNQSPGEDTLRELYERRQLSTVQIANIYGVRKISVRRWLERCGIGRRSIAENLANRGIVVPAKEELHRLIHIDYRSYAAVAAIYGVDLATIPLWLDRYEIPRPSKNQSRWKGGEPPSSEEIHRLYGSGLTIGAIAELFGVSTSTIMTLCKRYGVATRPSGFDGKRYKCDDGHVVRSTYEQRVDNWLSSRGIPHTYEPRMPFSHRCFADFEANGWYIEIWGVKGSSRYDRQKERKVRLCRQHAIPLIEIQTDDFYRGGKALDRKLTTCLDPVDLPLFSHRAR